MSNARADASTDESTEPDVDYMQPEPRASQLRLRGAISELCGGFGFIRPDPQVGSATKDFFFHKAALAPGMYFNGLSVGDRVVFTPDYSEAKGQRALSIVREESEPPPAEGVF